MKLAPREHGAYGQLGFPLSAALAVAHRGLSPWLLTASAVSFFLAHEPALVAFGRRGQSAKQQAGGRALRMLAITVVAGAAMGVTGVWLVPAAAYLGVGAAMVLGTLLAAAVVFRVEKTLPGELVAAAAMTSAGFAVALAGGLPRAAAEQHWAAWFLGFAAAVFPVRAIVVEHKQRAESPAVRIGGAVAVAVLTAVLGTARVIEPRFAVAAAPLIAAGIYVAVRPPQMKQMTRAGWLLIAAGALTAALLIGATWA